jgi:transcriptional regulator with XRE-family HTH domain
MSRTSVQEVDVGKPRMRFGRRKGDALSRTPPTPAEWRRADEESRKRIKKVVADREPSQAAFSRAIGVAPPTVSQWGKKLPGKYDRDPTVEQLWTIAKVYGISIDWLLGFDIEMDRSQRARLGQLRPALREELLQTLGEGEIQARPSVREAAVGEEHALWGEVVRHFRQLAEDIEQRQREIERKLGIAALQKIASDTSDRAYSIVPVQFFPAGDSRADTIVRADPAEAVTPAQVRTILRSLGLESEAVPLVNVQKSDAVQGQGDL